MQRQTVLLNNEALSRIIAEREVKQWLLARRMGIDRKTISRWLSGRTQRISKENLTKLCDILEIGESAICVMDRLEALGTREDRWEAARKLSDEDLVEIVGPSNNWELAESLVKSTIDPDMPAGLLSKLYHMLARVYHYMRRAEDFKRCSEICIRYAEQASDEYMELQGRLCLSTSLLMVADLKQAAANYEQSLKTPELFTAKALAASLSNLSSAYHQMGEFAKSLDYSSQALEAWSRIAPNMSLATSWYLRAQIHIELSMSKEARNSIEQCIRIANDVRYQRIINLMQLMRADLLSMEERHDEAVEVVEQGLLLLPDTPRVSYITLETAARPMRRAGLLDRAEECLNIEVDAEQQFGFELASGTMERARLQLARGDEEGSIELAARANQYFRDIGAELRCVDGLPAEHYRRL
ncbi:helix-turn-helix domain-containing protein [bacterium]|nr:helix-turn-helix domain-containing protein [bacterium]